MMSTSERISFLRRKILFAKLYNKDGSKRSNFELIQMLLTRCAIQDAFIQDRKLEGEFSEWSNEKLIEVKRINEI